MSESFILNEFHKIIYEYTFSVKLGCLWGGFAASLVLFTSVAPFFIKRCSASMFNISLVSQIFWSYLVEVIFEDTSPKGYEYYIGFVVIILGIYIFNKFPVTILKETEELKEESKHEIKRLSDFEVLDVDKKRSSSLYINDNISETSACSAFSAERKYTYYRNPTLSNKASKYLTHSN